MRIALVLALLCLLVSPAEAEKKKHGKFEKGVVPAGEYWSCFGALTFDQLRTSACSRSYESCESVRASKENQRRFRDVDEECRPQKRAAAFTWFDEMEEGWKFFATKSSRHCKQWRRQAIADEDSRSISKCKRVR